MTPRAAYLSYLRLPALTGTAATAATATAAGATAATAATAAATTTTEATAAAAEAAAAEAATTAATTTGATVFTGTGDIDLENAAVDGLAVEGGDRGLGAFVVRHFDEREAAGTAGVSVGNEGRSANFAELAEEVDELRLGGLIREITDVELALLHGMPCLTRSCLTREGTRVPDGVARIPDQERSWASQPTPKRQRT